MLRSQKDSFASSADTLPSGVVWAKRRVDTAVRSSVRAQLGRDSPDSGGYADVVSCACGSMVGYFEPDLVHELRRKTTGGTDRG